MRLISSCCSFLLLQYPALSSFPSSLQAKASSDEWETGGFLEEKQNDKAIGPERNLGDGTQILDAKSPLFHPKCRGFPFFISVLADPQLSCKIVVFSLRQASYTSLSSRQPSPTHLEEAIFVPNLLARNCYPLVYGMQMERKTKQNKASSLLPW